jgi:hypothetical protein
MNGTGVTNCDAWFMWNDVYVNQTATTITTYPNNLVWANWYANSIGTGDDQLAMQQKAREQEASWYGTGTGCVTYCWRVWNADYQVKTEVITQEAIELARQRAAELEKKKKDALDNAEALLFLCLTATQKAQYKEHGYFETVVNDRIFRITKGWAGNVHEYKDGKKIKSYCIHPMEDVPLQDNMLTQKLLLETQLDVFLRTANMTTYN